VIRGIAAAASLAPASAAAEQALAAGGSAVDALVAGFLAAAGAEPGVLLAPAIALCAGGGAGARAFDGRSVQPGRGAPRPRGYVRDVDVPDSARVAVPRALAMLTVLHAYAGRLKLRELARPGVDAAEERGAKARAALLQRVGAQGLLALRRHEVVAAMVARGGAVAGGALTAEDLTETLPGEVEAMRAPLDAGAGALLAPFDPGASSRAVEAIAAVDARGVSAVLVIAPNAPGLALDALELDADGSAEPVRRGVARVPPGTPLPMPAPLAIVLAGPAASGHRVALALAAASIASEDLAPLASGAPLEDALAALLAARGASFAIAAAGDARAARALCLGSSAA
jgi:gamma-glutamyltranspeptidase/glutathione hydrolase